MVSFVRSRKLVLTLFCSLALAFLLQPVAALNDPVLNLQRREHAALNRMIKKRSPDLLGFSPAVENAGADPTSTSASTSSVASTASSAPTSVSSVSSVSSAPTSSSVTTSSASTSATDLGILSAAASLLNNTTSSTVASTTTTTTSTSPTSTPTPTSTTPAAAASKETEDSSPVSVAGVTITSHVAAAAAATSAATSDVPTPKGSASLSSGAKTVLIIIGVCIGGGALIWTIFRKWKLRASSRFEDRLEPINWQPSTNDDSGIPGANRRASVASSFHSAGHDGLMRSNSGGSYRGGAGTYGATSLSPLPDHDFTAGSGNLAPSAYADMARGPSPQPQMTDLHRGPSVTHQYDYGVPLHHQGGAGYPVQGGDYYSSPRY